MRGEAHRMGTDLALVDDTPRFIRALANENLTQLERLLQAHAGFDQYLREQADD